MTLRNTLRRTVLKVLGLAALTAASNASVMAGDGFLDQLKRIDPTNRHSDVRQGLRDFDRARINAMTRKEEPYDDGTYRLVIENRTPSTISGVVRMGYEYRNAPGTSRLAVVEDPWFFKEFRVEPGQSSDLGEANNNNFYIHATSQNGGEWKGDMPFDYRNRRLNFRAFVASRDAEHRFIQPLTQSAPVINAQRDVPQRPQVQERVPTGLRADFYNQNNGRTYWYVQSGGRDSSLRVGRDSTGIHTAVFAGFARLHDRGYCRYRVTWGNETTPQWVMQAIQAGRFEIWFPETGVGTVYYSANGGQSFVTPADVPMSGFVNRPQ